MALLMLCTVLAATCRGCGIQRGTRSGLQRLSTMPRCRYTLGCRVPRPAKCIGLTNTVCASEQRVAGISRYICFSHWFRCHCVSEASRTAVSVIRFYLLQLPNYVTYYAGHFEEMQNKNLGHFTTLIHVLLYLLKPSLDCPHADAVVVVDVTPAMAAKIAISDDSGRTKVAFLAVSAIKQKDLANAVGGALQHAVVMRYMLEADQTEQGATAATWDTEKDWLLRGIPVWVLDSSRGFEWHQQVHAAEAVQEQIVTEAPADDTKPVAPAPTLPSHAKVKRTAKVVPSKGSAAGKGTPSSTKKPAKGKKKSDKPRESDDDDANRETEEEDPEQVLETQVKRKRGPAAHFDASPDDSGKDQPEKKAKTAASASGEFKPPSRSAAQPSRGTVACPSLPKQVGQVRWQETSLPGCLRLQDRRRSMSPLSHVFCFFLQSCVREALQTCLRHECNYMPLRAWTVLLIFSFSVCMSCTLCPVFVVFHTHLSPPP